LEPKKLNDLLLRAAKLEPVERVPIWLMRQAGRYLPGYKALRARHDLLALFKTPELAVEITLEPVRRFELDAAIVFSDILLPAEGMGFRLGYDPAPWLEPPVRSPDAIERVRVAVPEESAPYLLETIRIARQELGVPLIGFAAAPFTLAAYLVEGGSSRSFENVKRLLYGDPTGAHALLEKAADTVGRFLAAQVLAGAQAVQLFDSWAGILSLRDYRAFALPYAQRAVAALGAFGVPRIYFALDGAHLLEAISETGAEVIGLDWRVGLAEAARRLGRPVAVQGNLDPAVLLATPEAIADRARFVLEDGARAGGHIFNLGHGVLPDTPVESVAALVEAVRRGLPSRRLS